MTYVLQDCIPPETQTLFIVSLFIGFENYQFRADIRPLMRKKVYSFSLYVIYIPHNEN